MSQITMKQLLEAGVHFGHQTKRWNPKMKPYIFGARNGIYIIDLQKTVRYFKGAYSFVKDTVANGDKILFVGTKKQAQDAIAEEALRAGQYYVNSRWLGGMLTNFSTIKGSIDRLKKIEIMSQDGTYQLITKKEALNLEREKAKLDTEVQQLRADVEKNKLIYSQKQVQDKQQAFQEKVQRFQQMQIEARNELSKKGSELTKNSVENIRKIIADVAREQKLMLVFDLGSPPLYAEQGPDITDKVMNIYNSKHSN